MSGADEPKDPMDRAMEEAAVWAARMRDPELVDMVALDEWLRASPDHAPAYNEMLTLWNVLGAPAEAIAERNRFQAASPGNVVRLARRRIVRHALAGAVAASLLLVAAWQPINDALYADAVTAVGGERKMTLADESIVTLNTDSAMAYDDGKGLRRLELLRGEAYFEVAKDPSRPFLISAGDATIQVVGTRFNVRRSGARVIVSVTEGRVQLSGGRAGAQPQILTAGDQGWAEAGRIDVAHQVDVDAVLAWRRQQAVFYRAPVAAVVEDLNRYRRAPIVVMGSRLRDQPISGVFNLRDTDDAARTIEQTLGAKLTRLPGGVILLRG